MAQANLGSFQLPQPSNTGSLDLSGIKPANSGTVSLAEAIAKAKGIAAQKGVAYDGRSGKSHGGEGAGDDGPGAWCGAISHPNARVSNRPWTGRSYPRSRSRSRSPPARRENFRDNYNPYRDERRDDRRGGGGGGGRDYRDRSFSPGPRDRRGGGNSYSPPPTRGHGGRGDRSPRGGAADDNAETIQIDSSLVGLIIGRQGENLRRVESESGARVQFVTGPEASGPSRSCRITGSRQARDEAKSEIQRIVEDNGRSGVGATGATAAATAAAPVDRRGGSHQPALREGEDSMQIMVPDRTVGLIIGRGGETIRDLQERSKCHVNIVGESKSVNGQRPVNLIGTPQAAAHAKELIMEIVDSDTKNAASQGAAVREPTRAGAYGGVGGGANGGERVNDTIRVPSEAVGMIIGKGRERPSSSSSSSSSSVLVLWMTMMPTDEFLAGGETIKELQNVTGCKINVSPQNGPHETERDIGLVGPRESIESAKRAIMEKVDVVVRERDGPF